jgi:short-subunit dehydrogenase
VYTASKAAINVFTEPLAPEPKQFNVSARLVPLNSARSSQTA